MKDNAFSKLKKAIKHKDKVGMAKAIFTIKPQVRHVARARRAVTRGQFIMNETNRALKHLQNLNMSGWPPFVTEVIELCKNKMGEGLWNEVIYKASDTTVTETTTNVQTA